MTAFFRKRKPDFSRFLPPALNVAMEIKHRFVDAQWPAAEAGRGAAGHPLPRLAGILVFMAPPAHRARGRAGYEDAVAPDRRGRRADNGQPEAIDQDALMHLVGDIVGLLEALSEPAAVIAGARLGRARGLARGGCGARRTASAR